MFLQNALNLYTRNMNCRFNCICILVSWIVNYSEERRFSGNEGVSVYVAHLSHLHVLQQYITHRAIQWMIAQIVSTWLPTRPHMHDRLTGIVLHWSTCPVLTSRARLLLIVVMHAYWEWVTQKFAVKHICWFDNDVCYVMFVVSRIGFYQWP